MRQNHYTIQGATRDGSPIRDATPYHDTAMSRAAVEMMLGVQWIEVVDPDGEVIASNDSHRITSRRADGDVSTVPIYGCQK